MFPYTETGDITIKQLIPYAAIFQCNNQDGHAGLDSKEYNINDS